MASLEHSDLGWQERVKAPGRILADGSRPVVGINTQLLLCRQPWEPLGMRLGAEWLGGWPPIVKLPRDLPCTALRATR